MSSQEEDKLAFMRRRNRSYRRGVTLTDPKSRQREQDEGTRGPSRDLSCADDNLGYTSREMDQCCTSRTNVVVSVAQGTETSFGEVDADGNPDVDSRIKSCGWKV